jgi:hypothetical protein
MGPMISITVDHMRHQIIQHLSGYFTGQEEDVKTAVDEAVRSFDLKAALKKIAVEELNRQLESSLRNAFQHAMLSNESVFERFAHEALARSMHADAVERLGGRLGGDASENRERR